MMLKELLGHSIIRIQDIIQEISTTAEIENLKDFAHSLLQDGKDRHGEFS